MRPKYCSFLAALILGLLLGGSATLRAQGTFSGNINGTPGIALPPIDLYQPVSAGRAYTDLELTSITRAEEDAANQALLDVVGKLVKAVEDARLALVEASVKLPANPAETAAKATALGSAELALANSRATTLVAMVKKILPGADDAKIKAVAASMETRAAARTALAAARNR